VKIFKYWIALFLTGMVITATANGEIADRIVAFINDEVITLMELNNALDVYRKQVEVSYKGPDIEKIMADAKPIMLKKMIEQNLVDQEARKSGIVVKDEEVLENINGFLESKKMKMDDLLTSLAGEGTTFDGYKKVVRDQLVRTRLIRREIRAKISVSEEEIGSYYQQHRNDYEGKEAVRIRQILLTFPKNIDGTAKAKLRAEMATIHKRLKDGDAFEVLALNHSKELAAAAGGDLGFIEKGMILPIVENIAFNLKVGQTSDIIESTIGFHIIKVIDKRGAGLKPLADVQAEIRGKLEDGKMDKKYEQWLQELRMKYHIEIKL
jgi:peptidyl-prolyl cis-trans isomerase SurA